MLTHNSPRRHGGTTTKRTCDFCQEGLFHQISVELIDFPPQKAFCYLTYPPKQNTMQKARLGSPVKPWERHHQQPSCRSPGAALSLLQTSTMPACSPQAAYELNEETELSISGMNHIQQATAISHQTWLPPGQLAGSAEQAQVCRTPCGHTLSLQNHHPKHCIFCQGSYVGHVAFLGPAKSLWQIPPLFVAASYKKMWFFFFFVKCKQECLAWKPINFHVAYDCLGIKDTHYRHPITFSS